jgi:hypothetical protein
VSVTIHHVSQYLSDHLIDAPDTLRRLWGSWRRQGAALSTRLMQPITLRLPGRRAARMAPPAEAGPAVAADARPSYPWALVIAVKAAAAAQAAAHRLSALPGALRHAWMQARRAARLQAARTLALAEDVLKWCWAQVKPIGHASTLRAASGYSVTLAMRLGSLIGVR